MIFKNKTIKSAVNCLLVGFLTILISNCGTPKYGDKLPLAGITLTIDPGHGNTEAYDSIRIGPSGEKRGMDKLKGGVDIT